MHIRLMHALGLATQVRLPAAANPQRPWRKVADRL